jgi:hypothetical protein
MDDSLDSIIDAAIARREVAASRKALNLNRGDRFRMKNIKPKYLTACEVEFLEFEGNWLVCRMIDYAGSKFTQGSIIRLRHTHVGTVTRKSNQFGGS